MNPVKGRQGILCAGWEQTGETCCSPYYWLPVKTLIQPVNPEAVYDKVLKKSLLVPDPFNRIFPSQNSR